MVCKTDLFCYVTKSAVVKYIQRTFILVIYTRFIQEIPDIHHSFALLPLRVRLRCIRAGPQAGFQRVNLFAMSRNRWSEGILQGFYGKIARFPSNMLLEITLKTMSGSGLGFGWLKILRKGTKFQGEFV